MRLISIAMLVVVSCVSSEDHKIMKITAEDYLRQIYVLQGMELEEADFQSPDSMIRALIKQKKPSPAIEKTIVDSRSAQSYVSFIKESMSPDAIHLASKAATQVEPILKKLFDFEVSKREKHRVKDVTKLTKEDILAAIPPRVEDEKRLKLVENLMYENLDLKSVEILSADKTNFVQSHASNAYASLTDDEVKLLTAFYSHPDVKRERQLYFYHLRHYLLAVEKLMSS